MNRPIHEKIILALLMIIGSPFIIGGLVLFLLIYLLVSLIEYPFYYFSKYNKEVNEKYYLLITFSHSYRIYNKLRKNLKETLVSSYLAFENNDKILIVVKELSSINELEKLIHNKKQTYFIINIKKMEKAQLGEIETKYNLITYKD